MRRTKRLAYLSAIVLAACAGPAHAITKGGSPVAATVSGGNSIYNVFVQDISGAGRGLYTATTGPSHPVGNGHNVLFGNGTPATSFNTIRSYTTSTDYTAICPLSGCPSSGNPVVDLDPFGVVTPLGTTGFRTTYTLPGTMTTPDALTIVQDVNVHGTNAFDSTIEVTTSVTNTGAEPVTIGIRYLWDFEIDRDDGPTLQPLNDTSSVLFSEAQFTNPPFESFRMVDNDSNPTPPTYQVFGTVNGPASVVPLPTAPDLLKYVCWPDARGTAFDYTITPLRDIATVASTCQTGSGGGDVAVLYFFGRDLDHGLTIGPGRAVTVSASLFVRNANAAAGAPALSAVSLLVLGMLLVGGGVLIVTRRRATN